jgi:hypothetical protein
MIYLGVISQRFGSNIIPPILSTTLEDLIFGEDLFYTTSSKEIDGLLIDFDLIVNANIAEIIPEIPEPDPDLENYLLVVNTIFYTTSMKEIDGLILDQELLSN